MKKKIKIPENGLIPFAERGQTKIKKYEYDRKKSI